MKEIKTFIYPFLLSSYLLLLNYELIYLLFDYYKKILIYFMKKIVAIYSFYQIYYFPIFSLYFIIYHFIINNHPIKFFAL